MRLVIESRMSRLTADASAPVSPDPCALMLMTS
jgi:hypothetical protein